MLAKKNWLDVWISMGLLLAQWIKDLLAMLETQVQSLVLGRSPGGGHGNPLQCSCLENSMDREAWQVIVHRVTKSWTQLKQLSNTNICVCVLMYVTHNYMYIVYIYTHAYMHIFTYYYYNVQVLLQCCNFERFFLSFDSFWLANFLLNTNLLGRNKKFIYLNELFALKKVILRKQ